MYNFDGFTVDVERLEVRRGELVLNLEPKAFRVLLYLLQNRERAVTKDELIEKVWAGAFVGDNALTRVIAQIRRQLGDRAHEPRYIETLATTGYRFIARVEEASEAVLPTQAPRRWPLLLAAALALPVAAAVWWAFHPFVDPAPRLTGLRQITSSAGADLWPSFSPDGSQIAYSSNRSGDFQIYIRSLAPGGVDQQLTNDRGANIQPAWSPDGKHIAYVARLRGGIAAVPVTGGVPHFLTDRGDSPRWSPDGKTLVYRVLSLDINPAQETTGLADTALMLVDTASGDSRALTQTGNPPGGHTQPGWLPDNRHIVFSVTTGAFAASPGGTQQGNQQDRAFSTKPWIIDSKTLKFEPVEIAMNAVRNVIVSPDSHYLYFIGSSGVEPGLWRASLQPAPWRARRAEALIPASGAVPRDLALSADGTRIAISQQVGENAIWSAPLDAAGKPGGEPKPIVRDRNIRHSEIQFSADGSKIVYSSIRLGGEWTVYMADSNGGSPAPVTPGEQDSGRPSWFGKELTVAYEVLRSGNRQYWLAPAGGPPRPLGLKLDLGQADRLRVSRDGKTIAGHIFTPHGTQVVVEDLATGTVRRITPPERNIGFPTISPDGKWIAAGERVQGNNSIVIMPATGGEIRTLVSGSQSYAHDWSPDGDRISFSSNRDGISNIYWVSRTTGHVQQVTSFDSKSAFVRYPAWSPKGDQIVFERNDLVANIYAGELR